jgi:hypothetical protein
VPEQIQRRRDSMRPVFDVRTMLLGKVRLQRSGDLVRRPQRGAQRVQALSPNTAHRFCLMIQFHARSTPQTARTSKASTMFVAFTKLADELAGSFWHQADHR